MYACRVGMSRGVFTHEAGMGSAPIAHTSADTDHPARLGLMLFAFATLIAWYYYGEKCVEYLFRTNRFQRAAVRVYQVAYVAMVFAGCVASLDTVWELADLFNGLMAIPNLIALIALSPVISRLARDFFSDPDRRRPRDADYRGLLTFRDGE